jgi:ABC-2 type transport system permease protein
MNVLLFILQKELRLIFRDKIILAMMVVMPTMQLIIIPLAIDFEVKNVNLSVVDGDQSTWSHRLISKIASSGYFRIISRETSYKAAVKHIEDGESDVVMEIPAGFERDLVREGTQKIGLSLDAINGTKASIGGAYLSSILSDFSNDLQAQLYSVQPLGGSPSSIEVTYSNWYNPSEEYKYYVVPGILVLLLTLIGGFISALNIVREKEAGTIEQINVTPIRKWQFIVGKMIPFWVIGMLVFTLELGVIRVVYGIYPAGDFVVLYVFAAVYLLALLGFGLLISTISSTQIQAMFIAFFFMTVFMLMSGLFTTVDSMPAWARTISNLTPITHFLRVVRMIVLKGSGFADLQPELLYEVAFAIVLNGWAILNYRKTT